MQAPKELAEVYDKECLTERLCQRWFLAFSLKILLYKMLHLLEQGNRIDPAAIAHRFYRFLAGFEHIRLAIIY